jgi:hypothetical protein
MRNYCLLLMILISEISFGQITGVVKDSISNEPIPYVNIWVENENLGTTANENGAFTLNTNTNSKTFIFSSIGYETKKVNSELIKNVVKLKPKITELQEIVVKANKQKNEKVIGSFKKSEINFYFACGKVPWITARFFDFNENFNQTPFLKMIRILTKSDVKDSKFNIRLYSVNENGSPGAYVYDKNILGVARKGEKITEIDISKLNIKFPEKGLFIAIEWLIIESNKYEFSYSMNDSKKKYQGIHYEPEIGTVPSETDENSWIYNQGKWKKVWKNSGPIKRYKDKYNLLAIELTLTN